MRPHTKLYLKAFGYDTSDFVACEVCGAPAVDINHHPARGMGGTKTPDRIECLIAMCRKHHNDYADKDQFRAWLYKVHIISMDQYGVKYDKSFILNEISKWEGYERNV